LREKRAVEDVSLLEAQFFTQPIQIDRVVTIDVDTPDQKLVPLGDLDRHDQPGLDGKGFGKAHLDLDVTVFVIPLFDGAEILDEQRLGVGA